MSVTTWILIAIALVAVVAGGVLWYLFRPDTLVINRTVNEPSLADSQRMGMELYSGAFHRNAHDTQGIATIHQLDDGRRVLRLTAFRTSNGPDVRVFLVAAPDVNDEAAARRAGIVDLGALKGNIGDQNYDVPPELDLNRYRAVSIWCRRFNVNFGAAPLVPVPARL